MEAEQQELQQGMEQGRGRGRGRGRGQRGQRGQRGGAVTPPPIQTLEVVVGGGVYMYARGVYGYVFPYPIRVLA